MTRERTLAGTLVLAWTLAGCGGGGGSTGGSSGGGGSGGTGNLAGALNLVSSSPADQGVNAATDAAVELRFDGALAAECLADDDTWLEAPGPRKVAGSWRLTDASRTAVFTPASALDPETDYVMHVSPLTCDGNGRLLEVERTVAFRTVDHTAPTIVAATVAEGATGVSASQPLGITFSEAIDPTSVTTTSAYLSDTYGTRYALVPTVTRENLALQPVVDLPGDRSFVLVFAGGTGGVRDRAGNALAQRWTRGFRTATDTRGPTVRAVWPQALTGASPLLAPQVTFDESVDPGSVEASSVVFTDQYSSLVPFRVEANASQRTLRIVPTSPLVTGHAYTVVLLGGSSAATDLTGNPLQGSATANFTVGSDTTPPGLVASSPADGATRISPNVGPTVTFSEALDPVTVSATTVRLTRNGVLVSATVALANGNTRIVLAPGSMLAASASYQIEIASGPYGVRDQAGNPLAADLVLHFTTTDDPTPPGFVVQPAPGSASVPLGAIVSIVAATPLDPATVTPSTVFVKTVGGTLVTGTLSVSRGNRVIRFVPEREWTSATSYTITLVGGENGVRETSGNWLANDSVNSFRTGFGRDTLTPTIALTLNRAVDTRKNGMIVPPSGFTIDASALDSFDYSLDVGTFQITLSGTGPSPAPDTVFTAATIDTGSLHFTMPESLALEPGTYTVQATVKDLSGNVGAATSLTFEVDAGDSDRLPFERTQVVWTRFDLDRDGNGRSDFEDDLVRLGLMVDGDTAATNARMIALVRDGILAKANELFHRTSRGAPVGDDSVPIRLVWRRPLGVSHMQIAVGGFDPEGPARRAYGDESTGTLGRAYFDAKNGTWNDLDIATRPGLGVFPAEMFLFQTKIHIQVYPAYTTTFARRFLSVCPQMGGTPAGRHPLDAIVLAEGFDFATAGLSERARYLTIMQAADDWSSAMGVILAHEIGHSVGLVAPGASPIGLHGDDSLHDDYGGSTDVMAAAVGYDSLVSLDYAFRDLDLAYLRQRLMLR